MDAHQQMHMIGFSPEFDRGAASIREALPEGFPQGSRLSGVKVLRRYLVTKR